MYSPITLPYLGLFGVVLLFLFVMLELQVIESAYHKLGMSHRAITGILLLTIFGSSINIPIGTIVAGHLIHDRIVFAHGIAYVVPRIQYEGYTVIAINVGGALIPILISIYLLARVGGFLEAIPATLIVAGVVHHFSQLGPGVGIVVPTLIPGILAGMLAVVFDRRRSAAVAYVAGTMGCLLGADILNLGALSQLKAPIASIGGAGTFDGVFVSGIVAVLLA